MKKYCFYSLILHTPSHTLTRGTFQQLLLYFWCQNPTFSLSTSKASHIWCEITHCMGCPQSIFKITLRISDYIFKHTKSNLSYVIHSKCDTPSSKSQSISSHTSFCEIQWQILTVQMKPNTHAVFGLYWRSTKENVLKRSAILTCTSIYMW